MLNWKTTKDRDYDLAFWRHLKGVEMEGVYPVQGNVSSQISTEI